MAGRCLLISISRDGISPYLWRYFNDRNIHHVTGLWWKGCQGQRSKVKVIVHCLAKRPSALSGGSVHSDVVVTSLTCWALYSASHSEFCTILWHSVPPTEHCTLPATLWFVLLTSIVFMHIQLPLSAAGCHTNECDFLVPVVWKAF